MRTKSGFVAVMGLLAGVSSTAGAQDALPTFKSSVDLVPISAVVRDTRNRLVTNLTAADFEVLDKGRPCRIIDFQRNQTSPITLGLLVDVSGSMRMGPKLTFARQVVERISSQLADGRDEAALFTFDESLHEQQPFTVHPSAMGSLVESVEPFGTTSLYDAIAGTSRLLAARQGQRRAVVVFTDGLDTSSALTPQQVSALASSIDVPVYVVITVSPIDQAPFVSRVPGAAPRGDLRDLAEWTGGDLLFATAGETSEVTAHRIVTELRQQYLLAIESTEQPEWRPLDVRVRGRHVTVRTRSGYFGRDGAPSRPAALPDK